MTKNETPRVLVTEEAREVAAQIMELQERQEMADLIRAGDRDSSNTVQVCARFEAEVRTAAEAASRDRTAAPIDIDALADELTSAANIVTNGGCYEIDTDAVARRLGEVFARFEAAEAASREEVARLREAVQALEVALIRDMGAGYAGVALCQAALTPATGGEG